MAGSIFVLISLGNWQVARLEWKEGLIRAVNERVGTEPVAAPGPASWPKVNREDNTYQSVTLSGKYDHDREVHVWFALKNPQGGPIFGPGYMILTRFTTSDGWDVIVNRGFVPEGIKQPDMRPMTLVQGEQILTGLMRFDEPKSWLSPLPDKEKNVWIVREVSEMAEYLGMDPARTAPYWIDLTKDQGVNGLPQGGETRIVFTNNHMQYAATWYGLALVVAVGFLVWLGRQFGQGFKRRRAFLRPYAVRCFFVQKQDSVTRCDGWVIDLASMKGHVFACESISRFMATSNKQNDAPCFSPGHAGLIPYSEGHNPCW